MEIRSPFYIGCILAFFVEEDHTRAFRMPHVGEYHRLPCIGLMTTMTPYDHGGLDPERGEDGARAVL